MKDTLFFTLPGELEPGVPATVYWNNTISEVLSAGGASNLTLHCGFNGWNVKGDLYRMPPDPNMPNVNGARWHSATVMIPAEAKRMNFVVSADGDRWDNNEGDDYLMAVDNPKLRLPVPEDAVAAFDAEAKRIWAE